ncbi:hypothetical protein THAOC_31321 [Thalassiosira oceanica]|uniref:Leucine-rich repeat domain-containing protein n=1 Tax=Thalassiosira oceanica TaxID=159749 RepID=K0R9J3_THAOC|nr:hypothetical protein THAOC_31321 [Thalassiosira oceanica]|eukprot:EJK49770.1 hypothetical protein THAOC_31321 [Thalassiosira oceanica]
MTSFSTKGGKVAEERRSEITRVRTGPQVRIIPYGAFQGCINLAEVQFDERLEIIGASAFKGCTSLQQVVMPSGVTLLGEWAFSGCINLAEVQLNDGLQNIAPKAFHECTALRSVTLPSSVAVLGNGAFSYCTNLTEVIFLGGKGLLNRGFLELGLFSGQGVLNGGTLGMMAVFKGRNPFGRGYAVFHECPVTTIKISISQALSERMTSLPQECMVSIEGRIRDLSRLELTQDGHILACFPVITRVSDDEYDSVDVQDTNNQTAESLHQVLRLISFHELKESSILIELAMWKSSLVNDRDRADCRASVPDPAKSLIMEYCGFTGFLEPVMEGD